MSRLAPFASLPEVRDAVISDLEGTLIEHTGTAEAESIAAVMSYFVAGMAECGDTLGFGAPTRFSCKGNNLSCVMFVHDNLIWSVYLESTSSQAGFEKKLDTLLRGEASQGARGVLR